jgi:ABC-type uncharacterized transport system substrate-binding protein
MKQVCFLLGFVFFLTWPVGQAASHPHVWISMNTTLQFNDAGQITGIYQEWKFDEDYSKIAVEGLDANKDGFLAPEELEPLSAENIKALWEYKYFTYLKLDGQKTGFNRVTEYSQYYSNGTLTMSFTVPLKKPVDPRTQKVLLQTYDPTFFIAMDYQKNNPVTASGAVPANCKIDLKPVPADANTTKTKEFLASKDKAWQPEDDEDFGAIFAQPVLVACASRNNAQ